MKNICIKLFWLSVFSLQIGCSLFSPSVENISEISLRVQTGLWGSTYTVSFFKDGIARCECTFYRLVENNKPNLDFVENICADRYRKNESAFVEQKDSSGDVRLVGIFTGKINKPQFDELAQTVRSNGFFSIVDTKSDNVALDAPPNFVKVIYEGKTKELSDANYELSEIEGAVLKLARDTNWNNQ